MIRNCSIAPLLRLGTMAASLSPFRPSIMVSLVGAIFIIYLFLFGPQGAPSPEWMARAGDNAALAARGDGGAARANAGACAEAELARGEASTQAQAPRPAQIDRNGVLILVRSALLALDQANKTGNYTVLRDLSSSDFQANSAARGRHFRSATQGH